MLNFNILNFTAAKLGIFLIRLGKFLEFVLNCIEHYVMGILGASRRDASQMMVARFTERSCLRHVRCNPVGIYAR